jgi:DNA-binding transcriptional LysR family regulator
MNIRQLEAFRAVMLTRSVTKAGGLMHISQPAVSQLLKQFEDSCGYALFERKRNGLVPTAEAYVLFEEVQRLFEGVAQVSRAASSLKTGNWGSISIAAFPALTRRFLPEIVANYCADRPQVSVTLESRRSRSMIDAIATQRLDFGIGTLPSDRPDVLCQILRKVRGVCVLPPDHPLARLDAISATDLAGERFISLGSEDRSRLIIDAIFDSLGIERKLQIETPQSDTACALVKQGAGVSIVDPFSAYNAGNGVVCLPLKDQVLFELWLLFPASRARPKLIDDFIGFTRKALDEFRVLDDSQEGEFGA